MVFLAWHHATFPTWHGALPRVEKDFATPRNCHAWWLQPLPHVANVESNATCAVTHKEETHYTNSSPLIIDEL